MFMYYLTVTMAGAAENAEPVKPKKNHWPLMESSLAPNIDYNYKYDTVTMEAN